MKVSRARVVRSRAPSLSISATLAVVGPGDHAGRHRHSGQRLRQRFPIAGAGQYLIVQPADDGRR
jgi:gentisate 1,2-dioxygenase